MTTCLAAEVSRVSKGVHNPPWTPKCEVAASSVQKSRGVQGVQGDLSSYACACACVCALVRVIDLYLPWTPWTPPSCPPQTSGSEALTGNPVSTPNPGHPWTPLDTPGVKA